MPPVVLGGGFIKVNFHGKKQRQLPDFKYYTAIASVAAEGRALRPGPLARANEFWTLGPAPVPNPEGCRCKMCSAPWKNIVHKAWGMRG